MIRVHDGELDNAEIKKRFANLQKMVEEGKLFPNTFHFNAGPYLNSATPTSISIVWETDQPADFIVEYGKQVPLDKKVILSTQTIKTEGNTKQENNIHEITLKGLEPETPYFYNIKAIARDGRAMESGVLTFSTAVKESSSYSFAVVGDTEARPHINDRVSKLIWDERPNFIVLVGDLTDGGTEHHKFEWNYEYFQGITQLASRVPVFPVAGNGEEDLFWYNQYHAFPQSEGFYSFTYGNAEFFMLNSNQPEEFSPGKKQYVWLEEQLKKSKAKWKFVAHHHAPYSADDDDYGDSWKGNAVSGDLAIRKIVPLYEQYGVDMVFFGHLHTYQRTLPIKDNLVDSKNGVIYVQGGGGGGNLEDFAPSRAWFSAKTYRGHHYFTVTVHDGELSFKMYDTEGRLKDFLDLKK
jgi:acid phosphatase type 7